MGLEVSNEGIWVAFNIYFLFQANILMNKCASLNLCMVGFDNTHHVPSLKLALDMLDTDSPCRVALKLWISSDYTKEEAISELPGAIVLGNEYYWHGNFDDLSQKTPKTAYEGYLSNEKLAHLAYAFSRTTVFSGVRKNMSKNADYFRVTLQSAINLLVEQEIKLIIHASIPHAFGDLLICFAAEIIGIKTVYPEWLGFNDLILIRSLAGKTHRISPSKISEKEIAKYCHEYLNDRDLKSNCKLPSYLSILDESSGRVDDLDLKGRQRSLKLRFIEKIRRKMPFIPFISLKIFEKLFYILTLVILAPVYRQFIRIFFAQPFCITSDRYALVFLQSQPEMSTSPVSFDMPLEFDRVCQLAKRYPDIKFILKEHPFNLTRHCDYVQFRRLGDFFKISRLANVIYTFPSKRDGLAGIVSSSEFVVSTSSTASIEAVVLGTPALVFSNHASTMLPGVIKVDSADKVDLVKISECRDKILGLEKGDLAKCWAKELAKHGPRQAHISGFFSGSYTRGERIKLASEVIFITIKSVC